MTAMPQPSRDVVLVVDDSAQTVAMLAEILEDAGYTTLVALRGERAIDIARQVTPDLILLDAAMPGMDGFETCRSLKRDETLSHLPIIFMTGLNDTEYVVRGLEAGGVDYIGKPINPRELLARIRVHLANARTTFGAQSALDDSGQFLLAADGDGCLLWWTPQAGRLIADAVPGGLRQGIRFSDDFRNMIASYERNGTRSSVSLELSPRTGRSSAELRVSLVGRLSQGEYLIRVVEKVTGAAESILRDRLQITGREAQVLIWLARGKTNRDIADILVLSPRTVNKHLERIFRKIGVENRTSAVAVALKHVSKDLQ